jgi:hypothetical protein
MATNHTDTLAVLIDADNAQAATVTELLAEVSRYGTAIIKRAYGDWTTPNLRGWKDVLLSHGCLRQVRLHGSPARAERLTDHRTGPSSCSRTIASGVDCGGCQG